MAYVKTAWQDHITEYLNRYSEEINGDGSKTMTPVPGEVIQQGTAMSAANFNKIEAGIETAHADINSLNQALSAISTNDIEARREILDIKLKLDELNVIEYLSKTGIGFFDLFEDSTNIDTANTTATLASTDITFSGTKVLQMKQELFSDFTDVEFALYDSERTIFKVDVAVNNSATISMAVTPGTRTVGEKFYYNGQIYTITNVVAS